MNEVIVPNPPSRWIWQRADWPHFRWDAARIAVPLSQARRAQGALAAHAIFLDAGRAIDTSLEVLVRDGIATSAIEGEVVDPKRLRSSIARRLGVPIAGLAPASRAVEGLVDVLWDATRQYDAPLTLERLFGWHTALFPTGRSGLHEIRVGELRGVEPMRIVSGPIGRERVHYEAPPRERLDTEMQRFLEWYVRPPADLDGLLRAALAHAWFEIIHPFEDGNGRIGRAVLDMALAQDEGSVLRLYSLSARLHEQQGGYYEALERTSRGDLDVTDWLLWFLAQFEAALDAARGTVAWVVDKARFWTRHAHAEVNERQRKAINRMFETGPAGFIGGMTNDKYRHLTQTSAATAQRDLADLAAKGLLSPVGRGRGARYELAINVSSSR